MFTNFSNSITSDNASYNRTLGEAFFTSEYQETLGCAAHTLNLVIGAILEHLETQSDDDELAILIADVRNSQKSNTSKLLINILY